MKLKFVDAATWKAAEDRTELAITKAHAADVEIVTAEDICKMIDADEVRDASTDRDGFWFTVSTEQRDRDGDRIRQRGGDWKHFRNNPVVPFSHDLREKNVGKVVKLVRDRANRRTRMLKQFTNESENPEGAMVERMIRGKFLRAASIGFRPTKFEMDTKQESDSEDARIGMLFREWEGLESSVVVVPSNPGALQGAKDAGIDLSPMVPMLEQSLDGEVTLFVPRSVVEETLKLIAPQKTIFDFTKDALDHPSRSEAAEANKDVIEDDDPLGLDADAEAHAAEAEDLQKLTTELNEVTKGERLAAALNRAIDSLVTEDRTRASIIQEMARAAGINAETTNSILQGRINCPPLNRLAGFARVLPTSAGALRRAAESDGCEYGDDGRAISCPVDTKGTELSFAEGGEEQIKVWISDVAPVDALKMLNDRIETLIHSREEKDEDEDEIVLVCD